jgi:hypothetical protein
MGDAGISQNTINFHPVKTVYPVRQQDDGPIIEVDHLIIGAGPAGASMGCFLGQHGIWAPHSGFQIAKSDIKANAFQD